MAKRIVGMLYRAVPVTLIVFSKPLRDVNSINNGVSLLNVVT